MFVHAEVRPRQLKFRFGNGVLIIETPFSMAKVRVIGVPVPLKSIVTLYVVGLVKVTFEVP